MNSEPFKKYREERPWGNFERFTQNQETSVKILNIKSGESLSLQFHDKRSEFWRVLSGSGLVTIGEEIKKTTKGDEFFVPVGAKHCAEGGSEDLVILEISFGFLDENDVTRIKDKYGR